MRNHVLFLLLGALTIAGPARALECTDPSRQMAMSQPGYLKAPAPEVLEYTSYLRADGTQGDLSDFKGKPLLITFWATWCPNCRTESPDLEKTVTELAPKGMQFLQLSLDANPSIPAKWHKAQGYKALKADFDPNMDLFKSLCLAATPSHVVLDPQGRLTEIFIGKQPWQHESAVNYLTGLAEGSS